MLIGELATKSGFTRDTIRFYEKEGLIKVNRNERRFNNYKEYSQNVLQRLLTIKKIKGLGFTLNEVIDLLDLMKTEQATCIDVSKKLNTKIELVNTKIKELETLKIFLIEQVASCTMCCPTAIKEEENCQLLTSI